MYLYQALSLFKVELPTGKDNIEAAFRACSAMVCDKINSLPQIGDLLDIPVCNNGEQLGIIKL